MRDCLLSLQCLHVKDFLSENQNEDKNQRLALSL